ncbi:hypothetical protein FIBSPDRAFT_925351 [Athelia psychrophila]|uniref:Uncharacterized protein n=1 Tax=Athelia psychrophila TaxID=1759441 RepID=A0A166V863_9AGAM|nr:hypothetical protein FIBSPDRAFT_925351 [Fibularhizoctonia sp. CBS 109695]
MVHRTSERGDVLKAILNVSMIMLMLSVSGATITIHERPQQGHLRRSVEQAAELDSRRPSCKHRPAILMHSRAAKEHEAAAAPAIKPTSSWQLCLRSGRGRHRRKRQAAPRPAAWHRVQPCRSLLALGFLGDGPTLPRPSRSSAQREISVQSDGALEVDRANFGLRRFGCVGTIGDDDGRQKGYPWLRDVQNLFYKSMGSFNHEALVFEQRAEARVKWRWCGRVRRSRAGQSNRSTHVIVGSGSWLAVGCPPR